MSMDSSYWVAPVETLEDYNALCSLGNADKWPSFGDPGIQIFSIKKNNEILAGFYMIGTSSRLIFIENLTVKGDLSKIIKGRLLLKYFDHTDELAKAGYRCFGVVSEDNAPMLAAYRKRGHTVSNDRYHLIIQGRV